MDDLANRFAGLAIDRSTSPVPGTSGRFDMLPLELIQIIFAFFIPVGNLRELDQRHGRPDSTSLSFRKLQKNLSTICLCNKFFYAVAHRFLYHTIVIEHQYRLALLFRTLSSTNKLRSLVKTFAWNPCDLLLLHTLEDLVKSPECKAKLRAIEEDIAFGLHWPMTPEEDYCLQKARAHDGRLPWCSESLMTAVLGMLPGLKNLYMATAGDQQADPATGIIPSVGWVYDCLYSLLAHEIGAPKFGFLQNLKVFALDDRSDASYSPHGTMLLETHFLLQACPNLRRIEYRTNMDEMTQDFNFNEGDGEFGLGPHGAFSSSVEEVVIAFGCTPMATLPRLLRDLQKLKVLRAEFRVASADWDVTTDGSADVPTADETAVPGSWQDTRSAFLAAKLTLKELHLTSRRDMSWRGWDRRFPSGPWPVIDTLKLGRVLPQMSALTSLTIEPISLFNISHGTTAEDAVMPRLLDLLPPSLQSLRLVDYWGVAWRTIPGHDFTRKLTEYFGPRFRWGFGTASVFWKNVMTEVLADIANRPPLPLKEIIICTPASRSVGSGSRNEQPDGGGAWLEEDPSRSLFSQFERVGITLVVKNFRFMTSIPKEEWTFLEGY